jgi:hypothetical protein
MGTNRRKAVKARVKRMKVERKKFAVKVAERLLGTKKKSPFAEWEWDGDIDRIGRK